MTLVILLRPWVDFAAVGGPVFFAEMRIEVFGHR